MHYLCIDDESYSKLKEVGGKFIPTNYRICYRRQALAKLKDEDYRYFCWSLASYFTNYLVNELNVDVTYMNADYVFTQRNRVLSKYRTRDIGIFRHRQYA